MNPHPDTSGLRPFKPGDVGNPKGISGYTYRADAEKHLDAWCRKHGRELVDKIADEAKRGKPWAAKLMLDRVLPAVTRLEHEVPLVSRSHEFIPAEPEQRALTNELKGNGKALQ